MIEEKESLIGVVTPKEELSGTINKGSIIVPPLLQEKEVNPNENTQIIVADEEYNGLSKVTVNPIQDDCFYVSLDNSSALVYSYVKRITKLDFSNKENVSYFFQITNNLVEVKELITTGCKNFGGLFSGCALLESIPIFDWSTATSVGSLIDGCNNLTDKSLDNIMVMCSNTPNYSRTKTLRHLGIVTWNAQNIYYPPSRIQALPHYQDFLDAGWTIGY